MDDKTRSIPSAGAPVAEPQPPRVSSTDLLRGQNTVEIDHGGQRYLLRVTRENKLILTK